MSEEHTTPETKKNLHPAIIPGAIVIAGALIGVGIFFSGSDLFNNSKGNTIIQPEVTVTKEDHIDGSADAKIIIVEYSDLECPFCKRYNETTTRILDTYKASGDVALVFRHFPLDNLHEKARPEAEATECVAELGGNNAFWTYLNSIYTITTSNDGLDPAQLPILAGNAGVDITAFNACVASGRSAQKVQDDQDSGTALGIQGTPYSIFLLKDGSYYTVSGAYPYELLDLTIQASLKGAPASASQGLVDLIQRKGVTDQQINAYISTNLAQYLPKTDTTTGTPAQ